MNLRFSMACFEPMQLFIWFRLDSNSNLSCCCFLLKRAITSANCLNTLNDDGEGLFMSHLVLALRRTHSDIFQFSTFLCSCISHRAIVFSAEFILKQGKTGKFLTNSRSHAFASFSNELIKWTDCLDCVALRACFTPSRILRWCIPLRAKLGRMPENNTQALIGARENNERRRNLHKSVVISSRTDNAPRIFHT